MTDPRPSGPRPSGPRPLPGQEGSPVSRAGAAVVGVVVVVALALTALLVRPSLAQDPGIGSSTGTVAGAPAAVTPTGRTTAVTLEVDGMAFTPSTIEVPVGDRLEVTLVNTGDQRHDLVFANGAAIEPLAPGASATVDVGVVGASTEGWCSLPGHRQMGMVVHVVVTGTPDDAAGSDGSSSSGASSSDDPATDHSSMDHGAMDHGATVDGATVDGAAGGGAGLAAPTMAELLAAAKETDPHPAELPALPPSDGTSTEHRYTFTVTEQDDPVVPGRTRAVWTYNGTSPGPTLHGRVGDTFHITLVNAGTMGHSIDFHAGEVAPDEPMRTIEPGESLEYTFTAHRSGIWMYHCSTMPMTHHIANGMFGAVVIEPDGLEPVDRSYVLVGSELYLGADGAAADHAKLAAMQPDVAAFNGRAFQYDAHPLTARVGERVRFWVLNVGPNLGLSFHVVGSQFDTVWREGAYSVFHGTSTDGITQGTTGAQVLPLIAAEGGFVELVPREAGHYPFVNHVMTLGEKGAHGVLEVTD
ncbi:multicopper oxidase type 3 [Xylanimonas cellulosilytica DSM 15894]|uniref:Copper-containing nitrite reductase n=1 Tax=Xylanimonas cellulosilytica (strain DSM 15894 / JCM 12276 / CECT 5975 / KCTC 9989 / LMG 20990 / NBRC 107835 / XIL07) TaxID=446471 RepID=D1BSH2_XYLCX|nr:multicopper oxidase domain-containing protein [Xylanimonas cellulosilytica]ACZ30664.1 multicopper oxidase type 3 [Xylanimonas cellulosilytica DSM 15894]